MSTWDGNNYYFSGQGVVLIGERDANGRPAGLVPVGNVSDLKITVDTTTLEHKESQTGQRGIDLRLTTETNAALSMVMENFVAANLETALRGSATARAAGMVTSEDATLWAGKVTPLDRAMVSSVVVTAEPGATVLTQWVDESDDAAWDYKLNSDAGSILMNSDQATADKLTDATEMPCLVTDITVGTTTSLTFLNASVPAGLAVGDVGYFSNFAGASAANINAMNAEVLSITVGVTHTVIVFDFDTMGDTITDNTDAAITVFWMAVGYWEASIAYSAEAQNQIDALTEGSLERYMRFEGLNTADENRPVVVEVFKFLVDPLKELAMIGDGIGQFTLEGNVLADPLQTTGSRYFKIIELR